jgi:hypothetical protein
MGRFPEPKTISHESHLTHVIKQLAYLYKQKGDYWKSLDTLLKVRDYDKIRNVTLWLDECEYRIGELEYRLQQQGTQH